MSFINPSFLWAMFAVSVPIIIHLINFRRHKTLYFSNTSFLNDLRKETRTRTKLKQILILIARILTIAMLVIAFAGPFIPFNSGSEQTKSELNVIYIDNSFSMEAEGPKGQVFEQTRQIAKQIVYNSDAGMEYILITNDMLPEHQFAIDRDRFVRELDKCAISSSVLNLDDVILKANTLVPDDKKANFYVISDMQESFIGTPELKPDENINMVLIPVETVASNNLFIDSCWFNTPVHRMNQEEELIARVVNYSDEDFAEIPVNLYVNDSLKALASLNIEAGQTEEISIRYVNTESGNIKARLELSDYPVTYDNKLYFNYNADQKTEVLLINGQESDKYFRSLYSSDKDNFELSETELGSVQSSEFAAYDLIVLNNISKISSGLTADLQSFVTAGGSVALIPAKEIDHSSINSFLSVFNAGKFDNIKYNTKKISFIDYDNILFKNAFVDRNTQTDFPAVGLIHKYILFNNSSFSGLIRTENSSPVLIAGNYNKGRVYVFTAPVSSINEDLVKSPLFVPIFYNMAINSQLSNSLYAVMGHGASIEISYPGEIASSDIFRLTDEENTDAVANYNAVGKNLVVFISDIINVAGNYKLFRADNFVSTVSLNYNRDESLLKYYENEKLQEIVDAKLGEKVKILDTSSDDIAVELKEFSEGKPLWQLFLIFAFIFILIEILLSRFLK